LLAASSFVPYIATSSRVHAESPNDRLNIGAIGVGGRGSQIGIWAGELGNMVAACDVDLQRARQFANVYSGKCEVYQDYRKLLERNDLDVVTIGTPDHWHVRIAIDAMQSGLDVYCEKPVTLTVNEGKILCRIVKETGKVFQVGSDQRSDRRILKGVALARSGRIGHPITAHVGLPCYTLPDSGPFPNTDPPAHLDWEMWLGQAPLVPYCPQRCHGTFRFWLEYSGGGLTDWGAHHIDLAHWGLRQEETGPIEVEGEGILPDIPNGFSVAHSYRCTLRFADESTIIVRDKELDRGVLFEGPEGRFFVNRNRLSGKVVEELTESEHEELGRAADELSGGRTLPDVEGDEWQTRYSSTISRDHMRNFFDCVKSRRLPASDIFTHHRVMNSCHMCTFAIMLKRKLRWDPVREEFLGDDEANAMLQREQRKPYHIEA
jgi:predicted dehydrogenase